MVRQVTQYGITWTFDRPVQAGQFVTGDWWVVGPVTVTLRRGSAPKHIRLAFERGEMHWTQSPQRGTVTITLDRVHIHAALVLHD